MTDPHEQLPDPLKNQLRDLYSPMEMDSKRDALILASARQKAARPPAWRWAAAAGLAAALALAITLWRLHQQPQIQARSEVAYIRSGDIRDAYFLARQLKKHAPTPENWDINHDGHIDDADVQMLAAAAVRLPENGGNR